MTAVDKIFLRGLRLFGRHGVLKAEAQLGQPFVVDVELKTCLLRAGRTDQVQDTVDYGQVMQIAKRIVQQEGNTDNDPAPRYQLVETLASRIARNVLEQCQTVDTVMVRVAKPHVAFPVTLDSVGVEITRQRTDLPDL